MLMHFACGIKFAHCTRRTTLKGKTSMGGYNVDVSSAARLTLTLKIVLGHPTDPLLVGHFEVDPTDKNLALRSA